MKQEALPGAEKYTKARRWKKRWYRVMVCLAGVVVFCTVYAMILPAVTLASNPLDGDYAYVTDFSVTAITDGTAPFDGDNNAGNDHDAYNMIVRTFDTVTYTIYVEYASYTGSAFTDARVRLEFVLPVGKSQAEFDLAAMAWLENYTLTEDTSGGTTRQVLTGYKHLFNNDNREVVPGNFSNNVIVNIKMMKNEEKIQPIFYAAMEHNEWDKEFCEEHKNHEVTHGQEKKKAIPDEITVSAAPKYNVQIKRAAATEASMTYDFGESSSQLIDSDKALNTKVGEKPGRIFAMGVTLQLYNDDPNKKMRGIELPEGDITFDIKLETAFLPRYSEENSTNGIWAPSAIDVTDDYTPLVWSYGPQDLGWNPDRKTDMTSYDFAFGNAAPWNKYDESKDRDISCYDGGEWTAEQEGNTIHFTVKDYDFDGVFPCANASQSAADSIYYNKQSGIENIGCFSAAELYIVQPFTNNTDNKSVLEDFSTGGNHPQNIGTGECIDGAFYMTVEDVNLQSTSVSGQSLDNVVNNSNQGATDDDEITFQADLKRDGTYEQHNLYSSRDVCNIVDIFGNWGNQPGNCTQNGDDWAVIGTKFRLTFGGYAQTNGDDANKMCAAKWLLKFDPTAIELEPETDTLGVEKYDYSFLYAVKPDGECWADDAELKTTSMLDLTYYRSIAEAQDHGKIVGILAEAEPKNTVEDIPPGILQTYFSQNAKVKEDISLENKRFIITEESMIWTVDKYNEAINTIGNIPSLLGNDPSNPTDLPDCTFYIHPVYGNGGGVYNRHTGTYDEGDTLLVLSCKPTIFKNVEQTLPNSTDEKISYDLDAGQRAIDFVLTPKVECETSTQTLGKKVTVTIVDKLPNYLTYSPGSCYFGGTYNPTSVNGGTKGEITGGKQIEPVVVPNADGTQTLTWTITDVPVGQNMDVIHYSVNVVTTGDKDKDVPVGPTNLTNTAEITVEGSEQPHSVAYGNVAEKGILLIRGSASAYGKYSKNTVVEPDGEINYVIYYANNSETAISDIVLLDTMPKNGYLGNVFTGSYSVTSWKLDVEKCKTSNFTLYYTMSEEYAEKTFKDISKNDITGTWTRVAIDPAGDGSVTAMNGDTPPVAWALIGNLSANEGAYVDLTIKLNPEFTETNNVYRNTFSNSVNETVTTTEEHSVIRTLEGLAWMDDNADGEQNEEAERRISDIKVSLWKLGEGTKFTTADYQYAAIDFNKTMFEGLNASDLKQIRIVASGIPAGQQPQLFYATNNDDHIWYRAKKLPSTTTAETEYVYETKDFNYEAENINYEWKGPINKLRWDPFYLPNQSFTLKSITFDLTDGTTREFDFTAKGAYETYLHLYYFDFVRYGDPAYEADYYPYCYPGTNQQVSVETGKQISVLASSEAAATTYESGRYKFTYLPAGTFAVKFGDGTTQTISNYIASPANRDGVNDALDSDGIATYSSDRSQLLKTVITGIEMPKAEEMPVVCLESKYHDSGFYERGYELPKSGGAGAERYTVGGFLMFTFAAFILLNKHFRRRKS